MPQGENFWNPYRMIPVRETIERRCPLTDEKFNGMYGRLTCSLTNLTPLFVSGRSKGNPKQFMTKNGKPVIPGSSLKGTLRSLAEIVGGGCCITDQNSTNCHNDYRACPNADSLCISCRMFGMMERRANARVHKGNVSIGDAILQDDVPKFKEYEGILSTPDTGHKPFYRTPTTRRFDRKCQKLYFHQPKANDQFPAVSEKLKTTKAYRRMLALVDNHKFTFELQFTNLNTEELNLLIYILALEDDVAVTLEENNLKLNGPMRHKIGNAKSLGMGSCHISIESLELLPEPNRRFSSLKNMGKRVLKGEMLHKEIGHMTHKFRNDNSNTMQQLRKMMVWDEKDGRKFHYPSYNWFQETKNKATILKAL